MSVGLQSFNFGRKIIFHLNCENFLTYLTLLLRKTFVALCMLQLIWSTGLDKIIIILPNYLFIKLNINVCKTYLMIFFSGQLKF